MNAEFRRLFVLRPPEGSDAEHAILIQSDREHLPITWLENVQGKQPVWEKIAARKHHDRKTIGDRKTGGTIHCSINVSHGNQDDSQKSRISGCYAVEL